MPEQIESDGADGNGGGVQIDMISSGRMDGMTSMEKIRLILDGVRDGKVVILESGLSPEEESKLIEVTMTEISPDGFSGIEIESYPKESANPGILDRLFGDDDSKMTVIGPANQIETLHKDSELISAVVSAR
ncbi:DUF2073 domain-containing protein [Haladaptatus sp. F3-133]|jgi:hypothetical protein|uniref:DUF2073 domain-containing protein n=1 Tax=Halorutilus salinus TaxID=2487751 RepID=A0A9Q4C6C1_9EURY|nr:DUF2073 domain-containing protein [Halorutilus salinus]MCX2819985.1 DUF2073 domain-containing protein [Halorutilus salinus]